MQNNTLRGWDPDEQSQFEQCINGFSVQMQIRLQKMIQCITKILTELARIMLVFNISNLPLFPNNLLSTKCDKVVQKFEFNMKKWARKKKANHYKITKANLDTQARQQYDGECDFFSLCFITMNNYIQNCVDLCIKTQPINTNLHHIQSLLIMRYALIVFKRKIQWNSESGNFPIFRYKAAVKCTALHDELDARYTSLCIAQWIKNREAISRSNGRRAIGAKIFWQNLIQYLECLYHETHDILKKRINLNICNEVQFDDQHITVCGVLDVVDNMQKKRKQTLSYFEEAVHIEKKVDEEAIVPASIFTNNASMNLLNLPKIMNNDLYDINHHECDAKIAHLQQANDGLQAKVLSLQHDNNQAQWKINELQHDKSELRAQVQRLQYKMQQMRAQLNGNRNRERMRTRVFQPMHGQTARNQIQFR